MHYNIGKDIEKSYVRPMRLRWREMVTSNVEAAARWDRWDLVALVFAVLTALWVFALKLKTFYDLGYSSDLFVMVQAARSWLEGKGVLQDNCLGNLLAIHTYFLLLPLGLLAKPFASAADGRVNRDNTRCRQREGRCANCRGYGGDRSRR